MMNEDFFIILKRIDEFKRKFFLVKFLRGFLYFLVGVVFLITFFLFLEYKFYLGTNIRKFIFYFLLVFFVILFIHSILIPFLKIFSVTKQNEEIELTKLISRFFPEIKDKLINIIELRNVDKGHYSLYIINAAITQKSKELKLFYFRKAIRIKDVAKNFYFFLVSFLVVAVFFKVNQNSLLESGNRIIHYNNVYLKQTVFNFKLLNESLRVEKGNRFIFRVCTIGKDCPTLVDPYKLTYFLSQAESDISQRPKLALKNPTQNKFQ